MNSTDAKRAKAGSDPGGNDGVVIFGTPGADEFVLMTMISGDGTNVVGSSRQNTYGTSARIVKTMEPLVFNKTFAINSGAILSTVATGSCLVSILNRLDELSGFEENWDSYGADRLESAAVETARALVLRLYGNFGDVGVPTVAMPVPHGGVQLEWDTPRGALEVDIDGRGKLRLLRGMGDSDQRDYQEFDVSVGEVADFLPQILGN